MYNNSPDLYRTVNHNGIVLDCNKSYAEKLGWTKEEIIGSSIFEHTAEKSLEPMMDTFESWKKDEKISNREIWLKRKNGSIFPCVLSATTLCDEDGTPISSTIIKDMTEIYESRGKIEQSQKQIQQQLEQLKKVGTLKDEFISMITHELRSPLFPIQAYCELLKEPEMGHLNKTQLECVQEIFVNSKKLQRLIQDLLDAQKIELGKLRFNKDHFSLAGFMQDFYRENLPIMKKKKIEFVNSTKERSVIYCDRERLNQVLCNLVQNAVDFVPKNKARIEIEAKSNNNMIMFCVKDNGKGIPPDKRKNLFQKFYQNDTSLKRERGGSGLGLAICKGIVNGLGGRIWYQSDEAKDPSFCFLIPKNDKL